LPWGTCFIVTAVQKIAEILPPNGSFCCTTKPRQKGQTGQSEDKRGKHYPTLLTILEGEHLPSALRLVATISSAFCQRRHAVVRSQAKRIVMSRHP